MINSPSRYPGTVRSALAGRALIITIPGITPRRSPTLRRGRRTARPLRKHACSSLRNPPWPNPTRLAHPFPCRLLIHAHLEGRILDTNMTNVNLPELILRLPWQRHPTNTSHWALKRPTETAVRITGSGSSCWFIELMCHRTCSCITTLRCRGCQRCEAWIKDPRHSPTCPGIMAGIPVNS